jgi:carboxyl-terminal processing protease
MFIRPLSGIAALALLLTSLPASRAQAAGITAVDLQELELSYGLLSAEYYKKVDAQNALVSARNAVIALLKKDGIASPALPALRTSDDDADQVRQLQRLVTVASDRYGSKVPTRDITYGAISGLMSSVKDPYTVFLSPKEYAALNEGLDRTMFSGVGIVMKIDEKTKLLTVGDIIDDGPAAKAGVKPGDVILSVDGHPTRGNTNEDNTKLLRGASGTVVRLQIERAGQHIPDVAVTRAEIHQPSVASTMLPNGIGYTRVVVFGATTAKELSSQLDKLQAQGAKAYVLDLRDNPGGYLDTAVNVSSKFVPSGPIVTVQSRGGNETEYDAENTAIPPKPLAVLVNKYSASSSEITSGAIQDSGVGQLVGERTYGKGVVQTIHPMPDGSAVKITTARYFTPKGHDINSIGIQPDIVVPTPKTGRLGDPATDTQLAAAIDYLQKQIAARTAASAAAAAANSTN